MENENQKQLEKDMIAAFKAGDSAKVDELAAKIKAADPENKTAAKIMSKQKKGKVKEYETMLKKLHKEKNGEKLMALAKELQDFDAGNKSAAKWMKKAEKLTGKKEEAKPAAMEAKADAKPEEKKEKKPGLFAKLFAKKGKKDNKKDAKPEMAKEEAKAPKPTTPAAPLAAPAAPMAAPKPMATPAPAAPAKPAPLTLSNSPKPTEAPAAPAKPVDAAKPVAKADKPKQNTFAKLFGKGDKPKDEKSIIDNIVVATDEKAAKKAAKKEAAKAAAPAIKVKKPKKPFNMLGFSKALMNFTAVFIVFSAGFLYVEFIDKDNTILSIVGIADNTGSKLHKAAEVLDENKREETRLQKEIELYKTGYDDSDVKTVETIMEERINWPDIFAKINEVTNSVYELNDFFKYIEYNNYSFDADRGTIRVTGTLSDPLGRNLTRLVELEEAFKYYPQDKNNPDDTTEPYFSGFKEFSSFSKTLDSDTGRYTSNFQLSFSLNK